MKVCANINQVEHRAEVCRCRTEIGYMWSIVFRANINYRIKHITINCDYPYKTKQMAEKALVSFALKHSIDIDTLGYGKITK